jgi:hypothetical protein
MATIAQLHFAMIEDFMVFKFCLYLHIIAGIMGLVVGPVSMFSKMNERLVSK